MEIKYKELIQNSTSPLFTRQNLEVLLGSNRRTTDYRIKSLLTNKILLPIKPGWYLNNVLYKKTASPRDMALYIGCMLVPGAYVSLEYALSFYGFLSESVYTFTYVTTTKTKKFQNEYLSYSYRNMKPELFFGYTNRSFESFSYRMARPAKALFDLLYLTPLRSKRAIQEFLFGSRFNWDALSPDDRTELKKMGKQSSSKKMQKVLGFIL